VVTLWTGNTPIALFFICLVFAGLCAWLYIRVNQSILCLSLGILLFLHGLTVAIGLRGPAPENLFVREGVKMAEGSTDHILSVGAVVWDGLLVVAILSVINAIILSIILQKGLEWGMEEDTFFNRDDQSLKHTVPLISAAVLFIISRFLFPAPFKLVGLCLPGTGFSDFIVLILGIGLVGLCSMAILPMREKFEALSLGNEIKEMHVVPIIAVTGEATRAELMLVPLVGMILWLIFTFLVKKTRGGSDWVGLLLLIGMLATILQREVFKVKPPQEAVVESTSTRPEGEK